MRRWAKIWISVGLLAQAAHAAEVKLEIAPSEPEWLLPPTSEPCRSPLGVRLQSCTTQIHPEGITTVGEQSLVFDIAPLLIARDYEAVLARVRVNYGTELTLLEAGDIEEFLHTRMPTPGGEQQLPGAARERADRDPPAMDTETDRSRQSFTNVFGQRRGLDMAPDTISASMLYVIGHSYLSLERYLPAETAFELALRAVPDHVRAHESLGMLYLRTERYADARAHLSRAVQLGRNTAHMHAALGYLELKARHYWAAANAFQRALVLEPAHRSARRGMLQALAETHEHAKARALVEQLLIEEPDDAELWLYRARVALAAEEPAVALASLETALRLGDDSVANRRSCAVLHLEGGSIARAVELMKGFSARGIEFRLIDRALGWLADENEWDDYRELVNLIDRAALGAVEQSRLLTRRASLDLHDGDRGAARTALREALTLDPSNAGALMALGQLYRTDGEHERAGLLFRRASAYSDVRERALLAAAEVAVGDEDFGNALGLLGDAAAGRSAATDLRRNIQLLERIALLRTER